MSYFICLTLAIRELLSGFDTEGGSPLNADEFLTQKEPTS